MRRACVLAISVLFISGGLCLAQKPKFEAASVKLQDPSVRPARPINNPGRVSFPNYAVGGLISLAYGVPSADQLVGRPEWMLQAPLDIFEVAATMPPGTSRSDMLLMLQSLLEERFHLAVHREQRDFPAFELVVAKNGPKLRVSNRENQNANFDPTKPLPTGRDGFWVFPPGPRRQNLISQGTFRLKYQEYSISQLASELSDWIAWGEGLDQAAKKPRVTDKTGLTGKYDFVLEFRCARCTGPRPDAQSAATQGLAAPTASDPSGDSSLPRIFTAVEEQLGLSLVKASDVPVDVLVIDHMDRLPTPN